MSMNTEQKVTSLELSKALKKARAQQESEAYWSRNPFEPDEQWVLVRGSMEQRSATDWVAAFDCPELLEDLMYLDEGAVSLDVSFAGSCAKWSDGTSWRDEWDVRPAEALGKLLLWYLKEKQNLERK